MANHANFALQLLPRHFQMIDMFCAGCSKAEIAAALGVSYRSVEALTGSPLVMAEVRRRMNTINDGSDVLKFQASKGKITTILTEGAEKAAKRLVDLVDNGTFRDSVRLKASESVLDRVFGREVNEPSDRTTKVIISAQDCDLLLIALKESSNGQRQPTNGPTAGGSSTEQGNVHQTPDDGERPRPRQADVQTQREVIDVDDLPSQPDGIHECPQSIKESLNGQHNCDKT